MLALEKNFALVTKHIRRMRGGSDPSLVQASDGYQYVLKFANNMQGPNVLFNERIGSDLYRACGLSTPPRKWLLVDDDFIDRNPGCWIQTPLGPLRPEAGFCFGSRFLGMDGKRLLEILPGNSHQRIRNRQSFWLAWLIDICADHADNRQAVFLEDQKGGLKAFFVDHGHLFGGPHGDDFRHYQVSRFADPRVYPELDSQQTQRIDVVLRNLNADKLWSSAQDVSVLLKSPLALNGLYKTLQRLGDRAVVQNVLEAIAHPTNWRSRSEDDQPEDGRKPKPKIEILYLGIQGAV
jgi:hypothetical protein